MPFDALPLSRPSDTAESQFLERAMRRIANPKNWGRFMLKRYTWFTHTPRVCMFGALVDEFDATRRPVVSVSEAAVILAAAIDPRTTQCPFATIFAFNDSNIWQFLHWQQTRHRDVMAVFRKAIEASRTRRSP